MSLILVFEPPCRILLCHASTILKVLLKDGVVDPLLPLPVEVSDLGVGY